MALQNFGIKTIEEFFSTSGSYYIPNYQRDYAWDVKLEVNDLWEDFFNIFEENVSEYCIGQMVIHVADNRKNLIDGQQRTATLFILFLALRDTLLKMKNSDSYTSVQQDKLDKTATKVRTLLKVVDEDDDEDKLFLGEKDQAFFRDLIYRTDSTKNTRPKRLPRKKLIAAYNYFVNKFDEEIDKKATASDKYDFVINYHKTLLANFKILYVETNEETEAFMVFETLNARGKDLETSDLLKNYFYRTGSNKLEEIKKSWNKMSEKFDGYSITPYIRCLWNSKNSFCREKMLYRNIKEKCNTTIMCKEFTDELNINADAYLALLDPSNHAFFETGEKKDEIQEIIKSLSVIGVKSYYPLILSYYGTHKSSHTIRTDLYNILISVRKYIVRNIVICKGNPNSCEILFAELAKKIADQDIVNVNDIVKTIKDSSVADSEFDAAFMNYKEKGTGVSKEKIRFILRSIINNNSGPMNIITDNSQVHIEHIMPVKKGNWQISDDDHKNNLWMIGNLTLLENDINSDASNDVFDIKKPLYATSKIQMTKDLSSLNKWDIDEIKNRQEKLLAEAKKIWSF